MVNNMTKLFWNDSPDEFADPVQPVVKKQDIDPELLASLNAAPRLPPAFPGNTYTLTQADLDHIKAVKASVAHLEYELKEPREADPFVLDRIAFVVQVKAAGIYSGTTITNVEEACADICAMIQRWCEEDKANQKRGRGRPKTGRTVPEVCVELEVARDKWNEAKVARDLAMMNKSAILQKRKNYINPLEADYKTSKAQCEAGYQAELKRLKQEYEDALARTKSQRDDYLSLKKREYDDRQTTDLQQLDEEYDKLNTAVVEKTIIARQLHHEFTTMRTTK